VTLQGFGGILLVIGGSFLDVPVAIVLGIVMLLLDAVHWIWTRFGLGGVTYRRSLATDRTSWGVDIPMTIEVWNRKRLPLAWLRADDETSGRVTVRERPLATDDAGNATLRNAWTLAPFERVVRTLHVGAERRGVYEIGPVRLSVGDLFARRAAVEERPGIDRFIVRPRTLPTVGFDRPDRWGGEDRARSGLTEDPARFAGVRPSAIGDPRRRIHHRTSARLNRPMTKRFDPSRDREILLALDVQTRHGPAWDIAYDADEVEDLYVVAASIVRALAIERATFALAAAGYTGAESRFAHLAASAAPGQLERALDLLARLSSHASAPFERLLDRVLRMARPGTTVLVLTARSPGPFIARLRRLTTRGCTVVVLATGPDAGPHAGAARSAGLEAHVVRLDGPWRTAQRVVVGAA
jgi:uncharacterized protein (DUF58 family)